MRKYFFRISEIGFVRIVPGLLNVLALVLLAGYLELEIYGVFSTMLATAGLISSVMYGPIKLAVVPLHAEHSAQGRKNEFEASLLGMAILVSVLVAFISFILWFVNFISIWLSVIVIALGINSSLQPVLQARIQFWRYGLISLLQSSLLLVLIFLWVASHPTLEIAIQTYAVSMIAGALVSWFFLGVHRPCLPDKSIFKRQLGIGVPFTLSTLAENLLFMGFRYLLLLTENSIMLGTFSLVVDIAQRAVGIVINIASFAILPLSYRALSQKNINAFLGLLIKGSIISALMAIAMLVAVLIAASFDWFEVLREPAFSRVAFLIVAITVITNRLRKLMLDPLAVRNNRAIDISKGYLLASPFALGGGLLALYFSSPVFFYLCYLSGYVLAAALTFLLADVRKVFMEVD